MRIVRVRPFFIIGPRKTGDVSSDVARRVVAIEHGLAKELKVGNLDSVRDFLDVRDAVKAFHVALERGVPGEVYNICSGEGHSVRELVEQLCNLARTPVALREDPGLYRNLDEPARIGDNRKLTALGWKPGVDFPGALAAVLDFWRNNPDP
jgi:GDP-4-dehydro-6-deoxy-D-mannose reductase